MWQKGFSKFMVLESLQAEICLIRQLKGRNRDTINVY